jgi:Co/Zn/Cd efflux system component
LGGIKLADAIAGVILIAAVLLIAVELMDRFVKGK